MKYFAPLTLIFCLFSCGQTSKKESTVDVDQIEAMTIEVELTDSSSFILLLTKDGTINRKGDLKTPDKNFFMGISKENLFDKLRKSITNDLMSYCGKVTELADTTQSVNKIIVNFSGPGMDTGFEYHTNEPLEKFPKPILDFIMNAIQITDPWFKQQQETINPK